MNIISNDNNDKIFFTGRDFFASLLTDIKTAKQSIELETYIFDLDKLGQKIIKELTQIANNGVSVRIIIDGAGTPGWNGSMVNELEKAGAESRVFHPFPWRFWQWSRSKIHTPFLLKAIYLLMKINSRNHRKVCIIDKKIVYIGSFNISQNHLDGYGNKKAWRDTGIRLNNVDLHDYMQAFEAAWSHTTISERIKHFFLHIRNNPVILLNNTWYRRRILYSKLLKRIKKCRNRIWITNPYFVPSNVFLKRLTDAASIGIDVKILLPRESDMVFISWATQIFYARLLKSGVRVFEYLPTMLHAKTIIIDNWMTVGSSNLNYRSLLHDLEVDVVVSNLNLQKKLEQQFILDLTNAREVLIEDDKKRPWYQKLIGYLLLYVKYLF